MKPTFSMRFWTGLLAIVGGLVHFATPAAARQTVLSGQVLDAENQPVAGIEVVLHQVAENGGNVVATDTSDAAGAFTLRAENAVADAVYFVAGQYEGQLHIGSMLKAPFPVDAGYVLRVGGDPAPAATDAAPAAMAAAPAPPSSDSPSRPLILLVMAVLLTLGTVAFTRTFRPHTRRRLLLRLAQLEESRDSGGRMPAEAEMERSRILARLRYGSPT